MQYSPKLKKAMAEIEGILQDNDIAGFVLLHDPLGFAEYRNHLNPSYSCAFIENGAFRVKLKAADLPGGKVQAKQIAADTYNMVSLMTDILGYHAQGYSAFRNLLKEKWQGEEGDGLQTSHTQQNT